MDSTDYKVLNNLYLDRLINEGADQNEIRKDIEDLKKLYDDPDEAFAKKNYGSVDAYKKMIRNKIEGLVSKLDGPYPVYLEGEQRPKDEKSSEEIVGDGPEVEDIDKPAEREDSERKKKKNLSEDINILKKDTVMTEDKSIFDKLFEQVMGEAEDEEMELGIDTGDDFGAEGGEGGEGEDITITLTADQVSTLRDILAQVPDEGGEEEEGEDMSDDAEEMDMGYEEEGVNPFEEENQQTNIGTKPGVDPTSHSKPGSVHKSELPGDVLGGKSSGTGSGDATDEVGSNQTGDGKKIGHDPSGLTNPGKKTVKK